ncbi:hypothetical protein [Actinomadura harenae]|uniref:Uncharacterized protein n=1 Tax=Actinomadura harenae TaxID=2483351 RepID=A0A3M2M2S5_9ACTN|nr:hypothetical protein [Actinomadura harenae]RMI44044.1 hypothetical protein EBO15_14060 [Actinomadura harenae]
MDTSGAPPAHLASLLRHFTDLRDGTHGHPPARPVRDRPGKELLFLRAVPLVDPHARRVLDEMNTHLLHGTGQVHATGVRRTPERGLDARWELSWPAQKAAGLAPVLLHAFYGAGFHHPHLQGGTVGQWPLNVVTERDAAAELPTLRAVAAADLHNLVFQGGHRIVPADAGADPA